MNIHAIKLNQNQGRRVRSFVLALGAALALIAPTFLNTYASAAQLTSRSIALTNTSKAAENVGYTVNFTSTGAAGAAVIEFCSNSPFIPSACTPPTGFDSSNATGSGGFSDVTASGTNKLVVAGTINATTAISIPLAGITNPSTAVPIYARIVTYDTKAHAIADYDSAASPSATISKTGDHAIDQGSAAISISDTIGVTAAVLETMTFCVAGQTISADCNLTGNKPPTLALGETVGSVVALTPTALSTGSIFTQISTNAAHGAIVSLKSDATSCGGLKRSGDPAACDITPALNTGVAAGSAKFGVKTASATDTTGASGTFEPYSGSFYNNSTYAMNYVAGNATGITSPYGDPFLDTNGAPVNNKNMQLTFGASVSNNTPAGNYAASISLIATGTF